MTAVGKRWLIVSGILACIMGVIFFTHVLDVYSIPNNANSPAIEQGDWVWSTNLVTPKRYDHIVFKKDNDYWTKQLVGLPGDQVEFRESHLWINGRHADDSLPVKFTYQVTQADYEQLLYMGRIQEGVDGYMMGGSVAMAQLCPDSVEKWKIRCRQLLNPVGVSDTAIARRWGSTSWNGDFFGPVTVPPGKVFVAGNNRQNSMDSRYIGFVNESDIVGVILR